MPTTHLIYIQSPQTLVYYHCGIFNVQFDWGGDFCKLWNKKKDIKHFQNCYDFTANGMLKFGKAEDNGNQIAHVTWWCPKGLTETYWWPNWDIFGAIRLLWPFRTPSGHQGYTVLAHVPLVVFGLYQTPLMSHSVKLSILLPKSIILL